VSERPLTVDEVAAFMRVSSRTVMRAIAAGQLEASQVTQGRGGWRIRREAIAAWLESRSNRTVPARPLGDVRRVDSQTPAPRRPGRAPRAGGSGTLVA
jgi:excisionase family DNA binding protein